MADPAALVPENLPAGYRFRPTDHEIMDYLEKHQPSGEQSSSVQSPSRIIVELDVYKKDPWDLPAYSKVNPNDREWFFFTQLDKCRNGNRNKRPSKNGYWKLTGKPLEIKAKGSENRVIGKKQILVFHPHRDAGGGNTKWVIHEYREAASSNSRITSVVCRLMDKTDQDESSWRMALPDENLASCDLFLFESGVENSIDPLFK